ncbi:hypothetical protein BJX96DRAFT_155230 [Aspergillus floccosus]
MEKPKYRIIAITMRLSSHPTACRTGANEASDLSSTVNTDTTSKIVLTIRMLCLWPLSFITAVLSTAQYA